MEKPEFNLEMQDPKRDAEEGKLMEAAYGIKDAETLEDLSKAVYESGDEDMVQAFHSELFDQLKTIDPVIMEQYSGCDKEGYLLKDGEQSIHITEQSTEVLSASPEELRMDELKFEVQNVGDHPADQMAA